MEITEEFDFAFYRQFTLPHCCFILQSTGEKYSRKGGTTLERDFMFAREVKNHSTKGKY